MHARRCPFVPVFAVLLLLLAQSAAAQLTVRSPTLALNPTSATVGGTISVAGTGLADGDYGVVLIAGGTRHALASVRDGEGSFLRTVTIPSVARGTHTVELLVNGRAVDTTPLSVVSQLSVSLPAEATAGNTIAFSVGGLAAGTLSLQYDGVTIYGPVQVAAGSHAGKLRLPLDRPATLPASVAVKARNAVGKTFPRVGTRSLAVERPVTSPFVRLLGGTSSDPTPSLRESFRITGSVETNEASASDVEMTYFWKGADGSVVPMGTVTGAVEADGSFDHSLLLPDTGTQSATSARGSGQVLAVSQWQDQHGVIQQRSEVVEDLAAPVIDTDAAIDLTVVLRGDDNLGIADARIDLVDADLDDLYNSNEGGVRLDGAVQAGFVTQFGQPSDEVLGCPANRERQYTDGNGRAQFEFDLTLPVSGYNVDGSGPPPQVTIEPSEDCMPSGDINTPGWCREVDLAGVHFSAVVRAAHTGYGYVEEIVLPDGQRRRRELPVRLNARIDRYTGDFDLETCIPGQACTHQSFDRSATRTLVLPRLAQQGLLLADPSFKASTGHRLHYAQGHQAGTDPVRFRPLVDLTPLQGAAFTPGAPPTWTIEVGYDAGAGAPLDRVLLLAPGLTGGTPTIALQRISGGADCNVGGTETWAAALPDVINRGLRFPRTAWGDASNATLWVHAVDTDGNVGVRQLRLSFADLEPTLANLAGTPGLAVIDRDPHVHRLELGARAISGATQSPAKPEYEVGRKDNKLDGSTSYELCAPTTADCAAVNAVGFGHEQFSRTPATQPPPQTQAGGGHFQEGTDGWTVLFDKTIPLFRWYWGVPELISAEVFADLGIKAEHLLDVVFKPERPGEAFAQAGGRLGLLIMVGVDIDVLFGILVDAGAAISGLATSEIVATGGLQGTSVDECFSFTMSFDGWLEIGCPFANPFDPTCYIPDLETHYPIIQAQDGSGCPAQKASLLERLAEAVGAPAKGLLAPPPPALLVRAFRSQLQRRPAIAVDSSGERMLLSVERQPDDSVALVARTGMGRALSAPTVVSRGHGIRDTAVTWYAGGYAVAVWAQTVLPAGADPRIAHAAAAARHQALHFAVWDGTAWTAPAIAAKGSTGDGHVRLARCNALFYRSECLSNKVSMVFQRNLDGDIAGRKGIFLSHFNGTGWSSPQRMDQSGEYNITPTIAYDLGVPVVAWVRHDPGQGLDNVDARRIALRRVVERGTEEIPAGLPTRVAQPVLAIDGDGLALAFTRAAPGDAFVGTRQAMHLGHRSCSSCGFTSRMLTDVHGRAVYGERPSLLVNGQGEAVLTFRGLGFGPLPGSADPEDNLLPGDPLGMLATTGELVQLRAPLAAGRATLLPLTNDGGWHAQPVSAMDPSSGEIVALSMRVDAASVVAKSARPGHAGKRAALLDTVAGDLVLATVPDLPDLAITGLRASATQLDPGGTLPVTIDVTNLGSGWLPDETRQAWLRLWWDTPATRTTMLTEVALPAMAGGASQRRIVLVTVPEAFGSDERQSLRAEILVEGGDGELDGGNNLAAVAVGGMPVPDGLLAVSTPGSRTVNLAWTAPADARIAGYRIYMDGPDGTPLPLGSSFHRGFADLSALYGRSRSYRVSSYSARGIESELSEPVTAAPMPALIDTGVFRDSFEAP